MSGNYDALAGAYDGLMRDVRYPQRVRYLRKLLQKAHRPIETIADLGCGTGTVAWALCHYGYTITAMDPAPAMLMEAAAKDQTVDNPPLFVCQAMDKLSLPQPVDAILSTVDAVNYVTAPKALARAFLRMHRFLRPGGRLIFDVNTPSKYQAMNGQMYIDETDDSYCVWRTFFNEKHQLCTYQVDLFTQQADGCWTRDWEEHRQRAYSQETLRAMLLQAGFTQIAFYSDLTTQSTQPEDLRWIVVCDKD